MDFGRSGQRLQGSEASKSGQTLSYVIGARTHVAQESDLHVTPRITMLGTPVTLQQNPGLGHGFAVVVFAVAFLIRFLAGEAMAGLPFVTFFLATLIVAGAAGSGPAVTCVALCLFSAWYFFLPPYGSFRLIWPGGPVALLAFLIVSGAQVAVVHRLRLALERVEAQRLELMDQSDRHRLLYHELQHRVANGIQAVASTLSTQASLSPEAQPALDEAAERLLGVAEVHRRLHDPELGNRLGEMLDGMLRQLLVSAGKSDVAVTMQVEAGALAPEVASMIGLVVAEAASNSIKHAFAGRFGGSFDVSLIGVEQGRLRLVIEDDGHGFAAAQRESESLGMIIMRGFAERLRGDIRFGEATAGGARVMLEFPAELHRG